MVGGPWNIGPPCSGCCNHVVHSTVAHTHALWRLWNCRRLGPTFTIRLVYTGSSFPLRAVLDSPFDISWSSGLLEHPGERAISATYASTTRTRVGTHAHLRRLFRPWCDSHDAHPADWHVPPRVRNNQRPSLVHHGCNVCAYGLYALSNDPLVEGCQTRNP